MSGSNRVRKQFEYRRLLGIRIWRDRKNPIIPPSIDGFRVLTRGIGWQLPTNFGDMLVIGGIRVWRGEWSTIGRSVMAYHIHAGQDGRVSQLPGLPKRSGFGSEIIVSLADQHDDSGLPLDTIPKRAEKERIAEEKLWDERQRQWGEERRQGQMKASGSDGMAKNWRR